MDRSTTEWREQWKASVNLKIKQYKLPNEQERKIHWKKNTKTEQILRNPLVYKKRSNICVFGITGDEKEGKAEKCLKK